jgi:hypothetical protein
VALRPRGSEWTRRDPADGCRSPPGRTVGNWSGAGWGSAVLHRIRVPTAIWVRRGHSMGGGAEMALGWVVPWDWPTWRASWRDDAAVFRSGDQTGERKAIAGMEGGGACRRAAPCLRSREEMSVDFDSMGLMWTVKTSPASDMTGCSPHSMVAAARECFHSHCAPASTPSHTRELRPGSQTRWSSARPSLERSLRRPASMPVVSTDCAHWDGLEGAHSTEADTWGSRR